MNASLLGDKYFLDKDTADVFREGGTFHILVISGLHITFIGGLLLLLVMRLTRRRWIQFGVTAAVLWAYTLAVGADVPVVRAAIMFTVVSFSYVIYRQGSLLNALGVCGLVLLVWRPSDLFNPSFHLTFVSVVAILAAVSSAARKSCVQLAPGLRLLSSLSRRMCRNGSNGFAKPCIGVKRRGGLRRNGRFGACPVQVAVYGKPYYRLRSDSRTLCIRSGACFPDRPTVHAAAAGRIFSPRVRSVGAAQSVGRFVYRARKFFGGDGASGELCQ